MTSALSSAQPQQETASSLEKRIADWDLAYQDSPGIAVSASRLDHKTIFPPFDDLTCVCVPSELHTAHCTQCRDRSGFSLFPFSLLLGNNIVSPPAAASSLFTLTRQVSEAQTRFKWIVIGRWRWSPAGWELFALAFQNVLVGTPNLVGSTCLVANKSSLGESQALPRPPPAR